MGVWESGWDSIVLGMLIDESDMLTGRLSHDWMIYMSLNFAEAESYFWESIAVF